MDRNRTFNKATAVGLVLLLFFQLSLIFHSIQDNASGEPDIVDNGDNTITATWNFDSPIDYVLTNTTMGSGKVTLALETFWWNQTTYSDFNNGTLYNTKAEQPGMVVLNYTQNTTNLVKNGTFTVGQEENWVYNSSTSILSRWDDMGMRAHLNFSRNEPVKSSQNLTPASSSEDGHVYYDHIATGYFKEETAWDAYIGEVWFPPLVNQDYRSFFYFNTSSIPDAASVTDVVLYLYLAQQSADNSHRIDIHHLGNESGQSPTYLYFDTSDGTAFIENDDSMTFGENDWKVYDLEKAIYDIQYNMTRHDWFGAGIEEKDDDHLAAWVDTNETSNKPHLNITYLDPTAAVPFNETAYVNQTFIKNKATPDFPPAVNLTFEYTVNDFYNLTNTWLTVEIDEMGVWNQSIDGLLPATAVGLNIGTHMTAAKDYTISFQLHPDETSPFPMSCDINIDNVVITTLDYALVGNFTSNKFNAQQQVLWGNISWDVSLKGAGTGYSIRTRTSPDGNTWSAWSAEYTNPGGEPITSPTNNFIQFMVNLSTTDETRSPVLNAVNISYHRYRSNGAIEMLGDFLPSDYTTKTLVNWGKFMGEDQDNGQTLTYWYSTDSGANWIQTLDGNLSSVSTSTGKIRFRGVFTTTDPLITPILFKWNLTYEVSELASLAGGVDPGFGYIITWFNFTVNYSDPEGDEPLKVTLNITEGTSHLGSWDMLPVDPSDNDYTDGKWYYLNETYFARGSNYTYHFAAQDNKTGFWSTSGTKDGPYVINSPPKIMTSNEQGAEEGELYYVDYTADDLENDTLNWSLETNALWLDLNSTTGELEGTPSGSDRGIYWVNVTVIDGYGGSDWTNFSLAVGDKPPSLAGGVEPGFGFITTWFNFTCNYSDPEGDVPLNVTLNITQGTSYLGSWYMLILDQNDDNYTDGKWYYYNNTGFARGLNYTYHFAAENLTGFWSEGEEKDGPYVLNSPPKITTNNDQGADEGQLYYVDYEAADLENDGLTWSMVHNGSWLNMNGATGELQGSPPSGIKGYYWVNVTVEDGQGGIVWTNFTLFVGDDVAPVADAGPDDAVWEDEPYIFNGTNSQDNSGILNLTWIVGGKIIGYDAQPTHVFTQNTTHTVVLIARDPSNNVHWDVVNITVMNRPPVADAGPGQVINESETAFFNGSASYDTPSDSDSLILLWDFDSDGDFGDGVGETPSYVWNNDGTRTVGLMVIDDDGSSDIDTLQVEVRNVPPEVDIGDYYDGIKGSDIILIATASDPGDDELLFQWDWEDDGNWDTEFSSENVVRNKWNIVGTYTVRVRVTDGTAFGFDTAQVEVTERKEPPTISDLGIVQVRYNDPYTIDLANYVTDVDTPLSEMEVILSNDSYISINGLKITLIYPEEMRGQTDFVDITVSDGLFTDNTTLGIEVTANYPPTLNEPIPDVGFDEDKVLSNAFNVNTYFDDRDGETLSFKANHTSGYLVVLIDENGWVTFRASPNWAGTELVVFRASDPNGAYKEDAILVTVSPVNDAPIILREIPPQFKTIKENENWTIDLYDYFLDVDTPYLTFECNNEEIQIDQVNHTATWVPGNNKKLRDVVFSASDGEYSVSLEPVDLEVVTPEPFNWLFVILPFILGLLVFA
ncbi:MAG: hypothetical protein JSW28_02980, partial [Thermoplasmata archaeon]